MPTNEPDAPFTLAGAASAFLLVALAVAFGATVVLSQLGILPTDN